MTDWFIMVIVASKLTYVGPFTEESECRLSKQLLFPDRFAICLQVKPEQRA